MQVCVWYVQLPNFFLIINVLRPVLISHTKQRTMVAIQWKYELRATSAAKLVLDLNQINAFHAVQVVLVELTTTGFLLLENVIVQLQLLILMENV